MTSLITMRDALAKLAPSDGDYASRAVDIMLSAASAAGASDIHVQPDADGLQLRLRLDGVLQPAATIPRGVAANVIARLKVLAQLLTYRTDMPQEGRLRVGDDAAERQEMRLSTFPTLFGEKAVVRLFGAARQRQHLDELGLHDDLRPALDEVLSETTGAILISGPAGSGKTTTAYACLREIGARTPGRSQVSIEDPIEVPVGGVAQTQVNATAGLDLATGLRYLMRQDPEVILVGEIRDRPTAEAALQASLTGQLVLSTFHAGSAAETISRLLDMGLEPYALRSGLLAVLNQRLLRRLCACADEARGEEDLLGFPVTHAKVARGCAECGHTGYRGRLLLTEMLRPAHSRLGRAVMARIGSARLERLAVASGMVSRWQRGVDAIEAGLTSPAEARRVLGFGPPRLA